MPLSHSDSTGKRGWAPIEPVESWELNKLKKFVVDVPVGEEGTIFVGPGFGGLIYDPFKDAEKEEDERRQFRYDLFGIPIGGRGIAIVTTPGVLWVDIGGMINTARHFIKSIKWKIEDSIKETRMEALKEGKFSILTESDLKFMILTWRDKRLDPSRLSRHDRLFLSSNRNYPPMTNKSYLLKMERRGFVTSLKVNKKIVFKANFFRLEILHVLSNSLRFFEDKKDQELILGLIDLIASCYDIEDDHITIPERFIQ